MASPMILRFVFRLYTATAASVESWPCGVMGVMRVPAHLTVRGDRCHGSSVALPHCGTCPRQPQVWAATFETFGDIACDHLRSKVPRYEKLGWVELG